MTLSPTQRKVYGSVRWLVWTPVADSLNSSVDDSVGYLAYDSLHNSICNSVEFSVYDQIFNSIKLKLS